MIKFVFRSPHILIALFLFLLPFSWFSSGQIDWGGDSTRLYYIDPYSYLMNHTLFGVSPSETGGPIQGFYTLPYISLLILLRTFFDPTLVIEFFHGIKLSFAFLFTYLSICSLLKIYKNKFSTEKKVVAITGGLIYAFSPIITSGWDKAIFTHDQIFLNPLMFFLLLSFFEKGNFIFLSLMLFISLLFAHNFTASASPAIFSFYPITLAFLISYQIYVVKGKVYWKKIFIAFTLFIGIHAFHILPLLKQFFEIGSDLYTNVFTNEGKIDRGLSYFLGVVKEVKLSTSIFALPQMSQNTIMSFIYSFAIPLIVVLSLFFKKNKLLLLTLVFYLISLFFVSANITRAGVELYKILFEVPGFSMFRNFFGQWNNVYVFLYSVLTSIALMQIISSFKASYKYLIPIYIIFILAIVSIPFIRGELINRSLWQSKDVKIVSIPDQDFLKSIDFVKKLPMDSKILTLPLTDPGYQIVSGSNGGAYQGPSTIAYLGGKRDFPGLGSFYNYRETIIEAINKKDFKLFKNVLAGFNIGYIYYNSDPYIFEENFPQFPYQVANYYFPTNQEKYRKFIEELNVEKIAQFGKSYHIYKIKKDDYLPHIFAATEVVSSNNPLKTQKMGTSRDLRKVYIQAEPGLDIGYRQDIFEASANNPFDALSNNNHLHNHSPHISRKMDEFIYPLVLIKEKLDLSKINEIDSRVDFSLFLMSKRISELEVWGEEMEFDYGNSRLPIGNYYMNWSKSLERYQDEFYSLLDFIKIPNADESLNYVELVKVNEQLKRHEAKLIIIINNTNKSSVEKDKLEKIVNTKFREFNDRLKVPVFSSIIYNYELSIPKSNDNNYELLIENIEGFSEDLRYLNLDINGKRYDLNFTETNNGSINLPKMTLNPGKVRISSNYQRINYFEGTSLKNNFLLAENLESKPHIEEISEFKPSTQYLISFEYLTNGKNFKYSFLDEKENDKNKTKNKFFDKNLNSSKWITEQTIVTSDMKAKKGYIEFSNNYSPNNSKLYIRNLSVMETKVPSISFIKKTAGTIFTPNIKFQKINPVSYRLSIENSENKPYLLVLNDAFSKDWKIVNFNSDSKLTADFNYFNGEIIEEKSVRNFPGPDIFYGWNENYIADNSHFVANGYANGWYIKPLDIDSKKNYELLLIYNGQKPFYIGLTISFVTIAIFVLALIWIKFYLKGKK